MTVRAYKLGALGQDDLTGIKTLAANANGTDHYMTFESPVGTDYVVSAGSTFYITKAQLVCSAAGAGFVIGYGDDGVGEGAVAPTNWVQLTERLKEQTATFWNDIDLIVPIPSGKYPCLKSIGNVIHYVTAYGIEVGD